MTTSIFFSWQSDTPTKIGRNFLRKALEEACEEIVAESSISEALRDELVVDSDTQGEAGQPPIADTIFKKIDAAAVFVADVTFTAKRVGRTANTKSKCAHRIWMGLEIFRPLPRHLDYE